MHRLLLRILLFIPTKIFQLDLCSRPLVLTLLCVQALLYSRFLPLHSFNFMLTRSLTVGQIEKKCSDAKKYENEKI